MKKLLGDDAFAAASKATMDKRSTLREVIMENSKQCSCVAGPRYNTPPPKNKRLLLFWPNDVVEVAQWEPGRGWKNSGGTYKVGTPIGWAELHLPEGD